MSERKSLGLQLLRSSAPTVYSRRQNYRARWVGWSDSASASLVHAALSDSLRSNTSMFILGWLSGSKFDTQRSLWYCAVADDWRHWLRRLWRWVGCCSVHLIVCHVTCFAISSSFNVGKHIADDADAVCILRCESREACLAKRSDVHHHLVIASDVDSAQSPIHPLHTSLTMTKAESLSYPCALGYALLSTYTREHRSPISRWCLSEKSRIQCLQFPLGAVVSKCMREMFRWRCQRETHHCEGLGNGKPLAKFGLSVCLLFCSQARGRSSRWLIQKLHHVSTPKRAVCQLPFDQCRPWPLLFRTALRPSIVTIVTIASWHVLTSHPRAANSALSSRGHWLPQHLNNLCSAQEIQIPASCTPLCPRGCPPRSLPRCPRPLRFLPCRHPGRLRRYYQSVLTSSQHQCAPALMNLHRRTCSGSSDDHLWRSGQTCHNSSISCQNPCPSSRPLLLPHQHWTGSPYTRAASEHSCHNPQKLKQLPSRDVSMLNPPAATRCPCVASEIISPDRVSQRWIFWSNAEIRSSTPPAKLHDRICFRWPACPVVAALVNSFRETSLHNNTSHVAQLCAGPFSAPGREAHVRFLVWHLAMSSISLPTKPSAEQ